MHCAVYLHRDDEISIAYRLQEKKKHNSNNELRTFKNLKRTFYYIMNNS